MALITGTRLGPYEINSPLGAGGMGEVYCARDTKLGRDVALKVLPDSFASDPEHMARFQREAQMLAALNHPNIASIYGLEESDGVPALVMELVAGATLAEVLQARKSRLEIRKPAASLAAQVESQISSFDPLPIAKQIAEALEYAHERGIVHRDLKPANMKITADGMVKVLDFGLAKALDVATASGVGSQGQALLQDSPTLSVAATHAGVLLGTAAYMSPEQARGKPADRRADIWAFGCVLYEMLSGQQTFSGETVSDTLATVIKDEPDWSKLPDATPPRLRELVRRCLIKDPKQRLRDIGEARITIEETLRGSPAVGADFGAAGALTAGARALIWGLVAALLGAGVAALIATTAYYHLAHAPGRAIISEIPPPVKSRFIFMPFNAPAPELSPDGTRLAFVAATPDGQPRLWVRALDSTIARPLEGTENAVTCFWSADSRYLAFFAGGRLKKVDLAGGAPVDISGIGFPRARGGSWSAEGTILFAPTTSSAIFGVPAGGGTPRPVSTLNKSRQETSHRWPRFLPDGRHFIYFAVSTSASHTGSYVGSLGGGEPKLLLSGNSNALYVAPGYLLFVQGGNLMAQRFDTGLLELQGDPMIVANGVGTYAFASRAAFSASDNGMLAYWRSSTVGNQELRWFDRSGHAGEVSGSGADYTAPRISPDGKQIAVSTIGGSAAGMDLWLVNLTRGVPTRLTFNASTNYAPVWSPDGTKIAFASDRKDGVMGIYVKAANGTGDDMALLEDKAVDIPEYWSSDGRYLAFDRRDIAEEKGNLEIWILPLSGDKKPFPFIASEFDNDHPAFSPDGKWLAYTSNESGNSQVYIVPFPKRDGKWQVSAGGGDQVYWRHDGNELFYVSGDLKMTAVGIREKGDSIELGNPEALFPINPALGHTRYYDVSADGKKFVVVTQAEQTSAEPVTLVTNWPALLTNK